MKTLTIPTFLNIDLQFELANVGTRVGAFVIDWIVKWIYFITISNVFSIDIFGNKLLLAFIIYSPFIFYTFLMEWLNKGQTLGKMLLKIKVVGQEGNPPTLSQSGIRWMFLLVDCYLLYLFTFINPMVASLAAFSPVIGLIFMVSNQKHQRLGDLAAQTYIVKTKEKKYSIEDTIYSYMNFKKENYEARYPEVSKLKDKDMTIVKQLLEKSQENFDQELAQKLSSHIQKILNIEATESDFEFLRNILEDYNHLALKKAGDL